MVSWSAFMQLMVKKLSKVTDLSLAWNFSWSLTNKENPKKLITFAFVDDLRNYAQFLIQIEAIKTCY